MTYRLGEVLSGEAHLLRDAGFDRTDFATAAEGRALSFAAGRRYLEAALEAPGVAALIALPELAEQVPDRLGLAVAEDPELAFYRLHNRLVRECAMGVAVTHAVDPAAEIHPAAVVEPGCRIGPGVVVEAGATIRAGTILEAGVLIGMNAVIGCDGLFSKRRPDRVLKVLHAGGVHVGRDTEIQAGASVQRAVHPGFTRIGARVTVATGVSVGHGSVLGDDAQLAVRSVVCGFCTVGRGAWVGPGAVVANLVEIGDEARVEIGAVLVRSIPPRSRYSGLFARSHAAMRRMSRALRRLADREEPGA